MVLAHGVGTRSDLPLPVSLAAIGAGMALMISFVVLAMLWRGPRLRRDAGVPLPRVLTSVADASATRILLQGLTLASGLLVCVVGFVGPPETERNLAPWALFVTFWVGLVPASLMLGPVWRVLNPLRLVHAGLAAVLRINPERGVQRLPDRVGYWPAAASLAGYGWFELVYPNRDEPTATAAFITIYAVVHTTAAVVFGRRWFERGDGFEVYSTLLGSLSPLGRRRSDRALVLRNPLHGMEAMPAGPGLAGVVVALVGTTAYDGLSRTSWWQRTIPTGTAVATAALACSMLLIGLVFLLGTLTLVTPGNPATPGAGPRPGAFAHTLVPIAAGYAIAHYFSLLAFDGQKILILASDPFASGVNLLGTAGWAIDYTVLSTSTIATVQVTAIVLGHLVAAVGAHDRAVRLLPGKAAVRTQYPLLAAMVALTMGAVGLVFAP
ncbi:MAG: hypothetical protein M3460_11445 [Actinomycetota bacterium]|nr:hypothetical protein [Actinomycetota bacterium]